MIDEENRHMLLSALLALAKHNIPPDVQELLVQGNPDRGIPPGALFRALVVANAEAYDNFERARHRIARERAKQELADQAQELDMGYEALPDFSRLLA